MSPEALQERLAALAAEKVPFSGKGRTQKRLLRLMEVGREDLTLAKLVEAHWDAIAILAEAGRIPVQGALYAVWAAGMPGTQLTLVREGEPWLLRGEKAFCSGSTLVERALITLSEPDGQLMDLDVAGNRQRIGFDASFWKTTAFAGTKTAHGMFRDVPVSAGALVGEAGWYLTRAGFWHGALGPAACWAGGAAGLVDYAKRQKRNDAHTLAHVGAMDAAVWAMRTYLANAGAEVDADWNNAVKAQERALTVRHLVEQACTEVLRRFARAYGPAPLAANEAVGRRYAELDLFVRQSHAERDLEVLGRMVLG